MAQDAAFQKRIQRIGEIVEHLESNADPNARAMAQGTSRIPDGIARGGARANSGVCRERR